MIPGPSVQQLQDTIAAQREEIELLRARAPRAYILTRAAEWLRLFRECRGYLRTCHHQHGTDFAGRQHAMNALAAAERDFRIALSATEQPSK